MATPKQHDSKSRVGNRRSQKNVKKQNLHVCSSCKAPRLAHRACSNCGFYKGQDKKTAAPEMKETTQEVSNEKDSEKEENTKKEDK